MSHVTLQKLSWEHWKEQQAWFGAGSQFLDPDGWFPNHVPNPEDKAAMAAGVRAVNSSHADLGIVVDTDVDRSAVVAGNGTPINSNRYIALMAYIALRCVGLSFCALFWHRKGQQAHTSHRQSIPVFAGQADLKMLRDSQRCMPAPHAQQDRPHDARGNNRVHQQN